jgi:MFS family permease
MGPIADRFNRKALMITGAIFASALGFFLNHMGNSFTMLLVLVPIAIMATVGRIPALAYNVELGVKYGRMGSSMGITNAAQDLGHFIGPLITGWAIDAYGLSTIFYTGSIAGMLALPLMSYWLFTREIGYTPEVAAEAEPADPPK